MPQINLALAGLKVSVNYTYDYMSNFCKDYTLEFDCADIVAKTSEQTILKEKKLVPKAPIEACESLCIYRSIAEQLPQFDRFVFHGAAIKYNDEAYLFTAPSGTGKTTHINLWKKYLGEKVQIINGDKPIVSVGETTVVYGTPWAGKEGYQSNTSAPLKAICILKQAKENKISRLSKGEVINHLMHQVYMPQDANMMSKTLALIGTLIENIPVYLLECDISKEAFEKCFNKIAK